MTIRFSDMSRRVYQVNPVIRANKFEAAHKKTQIEKYGRETFVECPGIFDYKNTGWLIPAWDEFKVYSSENATMAYAGSKKRPAEWKFPYPIDGYPPDDVKKHIAMMDPAITDGIPTQCPYSDSVSSLKALHFGCPWSIDTDEEVSFLLMPPFYHSNIVDDFNIFPGIVDYNSSFSTINFIAAPRRIGTFTIKAGTPLLHVIPIEKKKYVAQYGPSKKSVMMGLKASASQFYRKYVMKRSRYDLELDDVD